MNQPLNVSPEDQAELDRLRTARDQADAEFRAFAVDVLNRASWRNTAKAARVSLDTLQRWSKTQ